MYYVNEIKMTSSKIEPTGLSGEPTGSSIEPTGSTIEPTGLDVHNKLKYMFKNYGAMMRGVPAETLGQNQAEISLGSIKKFGDMRKNIAETVGTSDMTKPTNSCGEASNEVCALLLGIEGAVSFGESDYQILSGDGTTLKSSLPNKDLLVRLEVDRFNAPDTYCKITKGEFNPGTAQKNKIYLLEDKLLYLNEAGKVIDLGQTTFKCRELFDAITNPIYNDYTLSDTTMEPGDGPEEAAICTIKDICNSQIDCWKSSHSYTIFIPKTENDSPRVLYPYQAYFGAHTLQDWLTGDKDESLSKKGIDNYIEQLALLGTTTKTKERSDTYAQLFSTPGKEAIFCAALNEKRNPLRVKLKITEVNPKIALDNLEAVQDYINTDYPGLTVESQCELYKKKAQGAMTSQLEDRLIKPTVKLETPSKLETAPLTRVGKSQFAFFSPATRIDDPISSVMRKENLKIIAKQADAFTGKEREKLIEFFKALPQEELSDIKRESETAQRAWDEQYGLVIRPE